MKVTQDEIKTLESLKNKLLLNHLGELVMIRAYSTETRIRKRWFRSSVAELHLTEILVDTADTFLSKKIVVLSKPSRMSYLLYNADHFRLKAISIRQQLEKFGFTIIK